MLRRNINSGGRGSAVAGDQGDGRGWRCRQVLRGAPEPRHADADALVHPANQGAKKSGNQAHKVAIYTLVNDVKIHKSLRIQPATAAGLKRQAYGFVTDLAGIF